MSKRSIEEGESSKRCCSESRCNYCFRWKVLVPGKPFCEVCARDGIECIHCHRPLPARLVDDESVCHACRNKENHPYQVGLGRAASVTSVSASEGVDPVVIMANARNEVKDIVFSRLDELLGIRWYITIILTMIKRNKENEEVIFLLKLYIFYFVYIILELYTV
jgi:hypothetical protein